MVEVVQGSEAEGQVEELLFISQSQEITTVDSLKPKVTQVWVYTKC